MYVSWCMPLRGIANSSWPSNNYLVKMERFLKAADQFVVTVSNNKDSSILTSTTMKYVIYVWCENWLGLFIRRKYIDNIIKKQESEFFKCG